MEILYAILFLVIVFGTLAILYVYQYNKLQHSKTKIDQAEYLIDESLRSKYDLLLEIDKVSKSELKTETSYFKGLEKVKNENISNFDLDRKFKDYISIFTQLRSDYSDFSENKEVKRLVNENKKIDEKLQAAKSYYNKYTAELNDLIRKFPSNIVARMHKMEIKTFFDGKNLEDDIVDDFKL